MGALREPGAHECPLCFGEFLSSMALERHACQALSKVKRADPGGDLERLVLDSAESQRELGLVLDQVGVPVRGKITKDGRITGRVVGKAPLDFIGHLGGRYVTFDAKSVGRGTIPIDDERGIKPHQIEKVRKHHGAGGVAFILVEFRAAGAYYALSWAHLFDYEDRKSVSLDYCQRRAIEVRRIGKTLDLVGVVRELSKRRDQC